MKNKEYMSIKKMVEYIDKALRYTEGCDFESFSENESPERWEITYVYPFRLASSIVSSVSVRVPIWFGLIKILLATPI